MSPDRRYGDQRDEPLDIRTTRENPSVDEEIEGFQNIIGPGSSRAEHTDSTMPGSAAAQAIDRGEEDEDVIAALEDDERNATGVDSATTGSPEAPTTGAGKQR